MDKQITIKTSKNTNLENIDKPGCNINFYINETLFGSCSVCRINSAALFLHNVEIKSAFRGQGLSKKIIEYVITKYDVRW